MFNSPVLDIAIGLVFIFLLYSLLATSIQEAIATAFSLRASMLKRSIIESMLSNTPNDSKLTSIWKGIVSFFSGFKKIFISSKPEAEKKLGDKFYDHPLIKNYGSSRIFPLPAYIPAENFSSVLIDILKKDFDDNITNIATNKKQYDQTTDTVAEIEKNLKSSTDVIKIRELLHYYIHCYDIGCGDKCFVNEDTSRILEMHLRNSFYDIGAFAKKLESWFDDSMNRVSGWYKRQTQFIMFVIGLVMAVAFNVDTIEIAGKLSTDKDARDKLVEIAVKGAEDYKDDPRVKVAENRLKDVTIDSTEREKEIENLDDIRGEYDKNIAEIKKTLNGDVNDANNLLAIGWDGYGRNNTPYLDQLQKKCWVVNTHLSYNEIYDSITKLNVQRPDSLAYLVFYDQLKKIHPIRVKTNYVTYTILRSPKRIVGYLILAFAICLGSPFWFDLLNKLVKIRATGKKETGTTESKTPADAQAATNITINTQTTGEEAVG